MDNFFRFARRLGGTLCSSVLVLVLCAQPANASTNPAFDEAMASCVAANTAQASEPIYAGSLFRCDVRQASGHGYIDQMRLAPGDTVYRQTGDSFPYDGDAPAQTPCTELPSVRIPLTGALLKGSSICQSAPAVSGGGSVQCTMVVTPVSAPTWNPYGYGGGHWETYSTLAPSGELCGAGRSQEGASPWIDANGQALIPAPPLPVLPATDNPAPPKLCNGGSCFDPSTNQFCATGPAGQVCIPNPVGSSNPIGSCATSGGATVCGGTPTAPAPGAATVPDPATQIQASDTYKQLDPVTGAPEPVNVVVFSDGSGTSSGQSAGDSGPAPASSAPSTDNGSFGGGTDCKTPPACSGDAVLCGIARTQWSTTCQVHSDLTGPTGAAPTTLDADLHKYTQTDVLTTPTVGDTTGDQANNGIYDMAGFGIPRECPLTDLPLHSVAMSIHFSDGCTVIEWAGNIILMFALFAAAKITAGSNN